MTTDTHAPGTGELTADEAAAGMAPGQLRQLAGLVDYDESSDPFPVTALDAVVFVVGNATQTAHFYQAVFGMDLLAYSGPETGNPEFKSYVLRSGSARFVINGGVRPDSWMLDHHRLHGDGVLVEPHDESDSRGAVRTAAIAAYGETR